MADLRPIRPTGGSLRGWSYYSAWSSCEWKAWLRYHYRTPVTAPDLAGIEQRLTPRPLLLGSLFHKALEGYYRSGWTDGRDTGAYDPDAAVHAAAVMATERADEWAGKLERDADLSDVISLVAKYHQHYGPGGKAQDFPGIAIAPDPYDPTRPALETELAIDLGDGLIFTSQLDAIVYDEHGTLWGLEHKTSAASRVNALLQRSYLDGQVSGQCANLYAHFLPLSNSPVGGTAVNAVIKDAGKGKDPFQRRFYSRTEEALEVFISNITRQARRVRSLLGEIDARVTATGETPYQAAMATLNGLPPSDQCFQYSKCSYFDICLEHSFGERLLAGNDFVPKRSRTIMVIGEEG